MLQPSPPSPQASSSDCPHCLNPRRQRRDRVSGRYFLRGYVYVTGESIHRVIKAIFKGVQFGSANPTPTAHQYYVDNFSKSNSNVSQDGNAHYRPCILLEDVHEDDARLSVRACFMGTISRTSDPDALPLILRLFICAIYPHVSLDKVDIHFHTDPEWPVGRNMWLILFLHSTTSRYMTDLGLWPRREESKNAPCYAFDEGDVKRIDQLCQSRWDNWIAFGSARPTEVGEWWRNNSQGWRQTHGDASPVCVLLTRNSVDMG
ncbi:hypothetical protein C8Q76DRAFT_709520 [Earliella scabrosa]|nr:hypothetical protein C8Q76DRAFT_709520 [Earliella scabrosa]